MTILEFMRHFLEESSCDNYINESREKAGICFETCKSIIKYYCGIFFECIFCRRKSSLKSNTVMECSKVSLHNWLLAFIFMSATKKGFSCLEFQRLIRLTRYETAFRLMHKIGVLMGTRGSLYILIEFDECFIEVATK